VTNATLLKKLGELSARVSALETENTQLRTENRLLRQKLDQYIHHYFGGQSNEGLDRQQMELLLQGLPIDYALKRWEALTRFVNDGVLEIDSNLIENSIRPPALGKKNFLFIGHPEAGERSAVIYTLLGSCRRHGDNPFDHLKDLFTRLPAAKITQIMEFTPAAWARANNNSSRSGFMAA
jgi:Transposase IS66 family